MPPLTNLTQYLTLPVIAAPMFLASGPDLVVECCRAGVIGTFPALNVRTTEAFDAWLTEIEQRLADGAADGSPRPAPYGVNLIVHRSNARLQEDLAVIRSHEVPLVITSLGAAKDVVETVHSYGGVVLHDVVNAAFAAKARDAGVDGLIAVSAGAGGHAGGTNPFALLAEIRQVFDGPVALAGCLTTGADVLAARAAGADFAYMGTRFLAAEESFAPRAHKEMIVAAGVADIVYTPAVSTVPANFLRASMVAAGMDPAHLEHPESVDLTHLTNPHESSEATNGAGSGSAPPVRKAWKDVWSAGQGSVGITAIQPAAEIVAQLVSEHDAARTRLLGTS